MSIMDVIERVRREPPLAKPDEPFPYTRYVCKVLDPIPWNRSEVERNLGMDIPAELATLWNSCGGLILYEDNMHRQWGLVVRVPSDPEFFIMNREYYEDKATRVLPGDLIFANFWGDLELGLIRNDKTTADYGRIEIVTEIGPRSEWITAAHSLEEFFVRFMDAHGDKYWEYHYQKKLADRATENLLRSRRVN